MQESWQAYSQPLPATSLVSWRDRGFGGRRMSDQATSASASQQATGSSISYAAAIRPSDAR